MDALEQELAAWREQRQKPQFFLRDDDAVSDTPALRRLLTLCNERSIPLLLAVIPEPADPSLGEVIRQEKLVTPAVHGFRHRNHAPPGEKTCELSRWQDKTEMSRQLRDGRDKLMDLFGGNLSALLVPPWNRIDDMVMPLVSRAGFNGLSTHGWKRREAAEQAGLKMLNTHVDIMHWSGGRVGRTKAWTLNEIAGNLGRARLAGHRPLGLLSHHLAHDDTAWHTLETALDLLSEAQVGWQHADELMAQMLMW